ncbi:MAG TPA: hypothetical protein VL201_00950, partial [Patescibacteria group bacterium]|nr:hypothetical protein [Patescibacteria group bacterium]
MYTFSLFIAYKYLSSKKSERGISSMLIMSWITIMISSGILVLIGGIMNGFEHETVVSLQGLHPQVTIQAPQDELNVSTLTTFLECHIPEIKAWAPQTTRYGVLYEDGSSVKPIIISIIFIDPLREMAVSPLQKYVLDKQPVQNVLTSQNIIIGVGIAEHLQLTLDNEVGLLVADTDTHSAEKFSYEKVKVRVAG